jgi:hypothetical protein
MPLRSKSVGDVLNSAHELRGDAVVTALTTGNIFQLRMMKVMSNAVQELVDTFEFSWRFQRAILVTSAEITTENAAVTNGDATVNSVTSAGASADNWGSVTDAMFFRNIADQTSYAISSITTSGSPDTIELERAYLGTTATAASYRILQDIYPISTSGFGELVTATYGDSPSWTSSLGDRSLPDNHLQVVPFRDLMAMAGGDRHRDTSGKPRFIAQIGTDSSNNPQFALWPYPNAAYLIELFHTLDYAEASAFDTVLFGTDAPSSAYDYVEHKVLAATYEWDRNQSGAAAEEQRAANSLANVLRREHRERGSVGIGINPNRRHYGHHYRGRSGISFDSVYRRS